MSSMIAKAFIAALAAGAAQALPYAPSANTTSSTGYTGASTTYAPSSTGAPVPAASIDPNFVRKLIDEPTQVQRFNDLLTVDGNGTTLLDDETLRSRLVFDFNEAADKLVQAGGRGVALANQAKFPIVAGEGISVAMAFLNPCGMNTPHIHPRATEFLTVTSGTVMTGFVLENGFLPLPGGLTTQINTTLSANQGTFNPTCDNATFVAALNSADPGASQIAQNFFSLDAGIVDASIGFNNIPEQITPDTIEQFRQHIPPNLALAVDECKKTCYPGKY
ncbi:hypothetical protein H2203_004402 [Taxawa tesnikishii (nom. ined.)]|nr:hypothetical protein H2203_004402 [Dothideales sp. JES 119]